MLDCAFCLLWETMAGPWLGADGLFHAASPNQLMSAHPGTRGFSGQTVKPRLRYSSGPYDSRMEEVGVAQEACCLGSSPGFLQGARRENEQRIGASDTRGRERDRDAGEAGRKSSPAYFAACSIVVVVVQLNIRLTSSRSLCSLFQVLYCSLGEH